MATLNDPGHLLTYNLAENSSTVSTKHVYSGDSKDFAGQVKKFEKLAGRHHKHHHKHHFTASWDPAKTVFASWFGVNDVHQTYNSKQDPDEKLYQAIMSDYDKQLRRLHKLGARNFVILNVPPMDRSPATEHNGVDAQHREKRAVQIFNNDLQAMVYSFAKVHNKDTTVQLYDTNKLFTEVLKKPQSHPQTAGYLVTNNYCKAYNLGSAWNATSSDCSHDLVEYFWLDGTHATWPMHQLLAKEVSEQLTHLHSKVHSGSLRTQP